MHRIVVVRDRAGHSKCTFHVYFGYGCIISSDTNCLCHQDKINESDLVMHNAYDWLQGFAFAGSVSSPCVFVLILQSLQKSSHMRLKKHSRLKGIHVSKVFASQKYLCHVCVHSPQIQNSNRMVISYLCTCHIIGISTHLGMSYHVLGISFTLISPVLVAGIQTHMLDCRNSLFFKCGT
jgi:hypothetical protein